MSKRYVALVSGELKGSGAIVEPLDGKVPQGWRGRVGRIMTSYFGAKVHVGNISISNYV